MQTTQFYSADRSLRRKSISTIFLPHLPTPPLLLVELLLNIQVTTPEEADGFVGRTPVHLAVFTSTVAEICFKNWFKLILVQRIIRLEMDVVSTIQVCGASQI